MVERKPTSKLLSRKFPCYCTLLVLPEKKSRARARERERERETEVVGNVDGFVEMLMYMAVLSGTG